MTDKIIEELYEYNKDIYKIITYILKSNNLLFIDTDIDKDNHEYEKWDLNYIYRYKIINNNNDTNNIKLDLLDYGFYDQYNLFYFYIDDQLILNFDSTSNIFTFLFNNKNIFKQYLNNNNRQLITSISKTSISKTSISKTSISKFNPIIKYYCCYYDPKYISIRIYFIKYNIYIKKIWRYFYNDSLYSFYNYKNNFLFY